MKLDFTSNHKLLFGTAFLVFFILSYLIAIQPASEAKKQVKPLIESNPMTKQQLQGFQVYIGEGCAYCHTQQVRPLVMDEGFGRPSVPGDYASQKPLNWWMQTPNVLGSERIGPDLSNVGARRNNEVWNYIHLYQPRSVVPNSAMPAYHWLFEKKNDLKLNETALPVPVKFRKGYNYIIPTQKAKDLVAYILYLQQPALSNAEVINENARYKRTTVRNNFIDGINVYQSQCAACHGANGKAVESLFPSLKDSMPLSKKTIDQKMQVILNGITDAKNPIRNMPAYRQLLSDEEIAAVVNYMEKAWNQKNGRIISAEEIRTLRMQKK